jgi:hypothetical protein
VNDAFNAAEREVFTALGFSIHETTARAEGPMALEIVRHGAWHFRLTITLPNGKGIAGFVATTKIMGGGAAS